MQNMLMEGFRDGDEIPSEVSTLQLVTEATWIPGWRRALRRAGKSSSCPEALFATPDLFMYKLGSY